MCYASPESMCDSSQNRNWTVTGTGYGHDAGRETCTHLREQTLTRRYIDSRGPAENQVSTRFQTGMSTAAADPVRMPIAGPARTVTPQFHTLGVEPAYVGDHARSTPRGIGSALDYPEPVTPKEHPTPLRTAAISFEPQPEPQSVSTLEPVSLV